MIATVTLVSLSLTLTGSGGNDDETGARIIGLEESGARSGEFSEFKAASFTPTINPGEALEISQSFVRRSMGIETVSELPTRSAIGAFSGRRHDTGVEVDNVNVQIVVFYDYPAVPRLPLGYSGPPPTDPRYTVAIEDSTGDVIFSLLTWERAEES